MLSFGFKVAGMSNSSGVIATALAFGLVLLVLVYAIGPISGCHVNPAVTIGFLAARRISVSEAIGYWIAQCVGGIGGAAVLYGIASGTPHYSVHTIGVGADGYGSYSMIGLNAAGAFGAEVVLTATFVLVILVVTRHEVNVPVTGLVIGFSLMLIHVMSIPLDGTSVNPARSLGPAVFVGGGQLSQLWLFIVAPLVGGVIAAAIDRLLYSRAETTTNTDAVPDTQAS
ncbi:MAG: aquaporin [Acidimicrobiales bacterium]